MCSDGFRIRVAKSGDAAQLGIIGPAIYAESYGHMWRDIDAYADRLATFGDEAVAGFIARADTRMWVIEGKRRIVGFLSLTMGAADPVDRRTDGAEVPRIYLLAPARGKGLARKMLHEADRYACSMGANHLWLDAMTQAPWAWKTYRRWGFIEIGTTTLDGIRPEFRNMIVLRRNCE